jgi:polyferredoxin
VQDVTFRTLLYRYFFFGWLFKDTSCGNVLERAAAWRYNKERSHWLLTYMRRWLWCTLLFYGLGGLVELMLNSPGLSAFFYVPSAISVSVNAVIGAAWLGLKALPGPF